MKTIILFFLLLPVLAVSEQKENRFTKLFSEMNSASVAELNQRFDSLFSYTITTDPQYAYCPALPEYINSISASYSVDVKYLHADIPHCVYASKAELDSIDAVYQAIEDSIQLAEQQAIQDSLNRVQFIADSLKQIKVDALKAQVYQANVQQALTMMMLALDQADVDPDTLTPLILRGNEGEYYMKVSDYVFKIEEAVLTISIPNHNRQAVNEMDRNKGTIVISKYALENFTRIDGKPMPNERVEIP